MLQFLLLIAFVGIAAGLAWFLVSRDRGEKEPVDALWIAVGFGMLGALIAGLVEPHLVQADNLITGMPRGTMFSTAVLIGLIEESCKFIPLAIFIYKKKFFNEHTDGVIYFALAGLGFGLPENILYTLQYGTKTGLLRLVLTPLFHAAATGTIGYYLAKRKLGRKNVFGIILPLLIVAIIHGLYNFGLATGSDFFGTVSVLTTLILTAGLFLLLLRATQRDQALALSAVGHNYFCRNCGRANPKHNLYCVYCGKNA